MPPKLWDTVDRWGPAVVSIITLLAVIAIGWMYSERTAHVEGQLESLHRQMDSYIRLDAARMDETAALRSWAIAVYERGSAHGWDMPKLPEADRLKAQRQTQPKKEK